MSNETVGKELGVVKWFNVPKGFGFIVPDNDQAGADLFVHITAIRGDDSKSLTEGDRVSFDITKGPKGLQAENVRVVEKAAPRSYPPEVRWR